MTERDRFDDPLAQALYDACEAAERRGVPRDGVLETLVRLTAAMLTASHHDHPGVAWEHYQHLAVEHYRVLLDEMHRHQP